MINNQKLLLNDLFQHRCNAIYDPEFQKHLANAPWTEWVSKPGYFEVTDEYIKKFSEWICSGVQNKLSDDFKFDSNRFSRTDIIVGTTQSFDESYFRYSGRRLRLFRGEYGYHRRCYKKNNLWLDKSLSEGREWAEPLDKNDWVIVSHPFCGTGAEHSKFRELLKKCEKIGVPVCVDCAWYGTCFGMDFNFDNPSIAEISFSLSKGIGLGSMRTGLRFSNYLFDEQMPIAQQNNYKHLVKDNCQIGLYQMNQFNPDWQVNKYLDWYNKLCNEYEFKKTNCLHVVLLKESHENFFDFLVDESYSRVGVREALKAIRQGRLKL